MAQKTKKQRLLVALGTVAHNRPFTVSELSQYTGRPAGPFVSSLARRGLLERVGKEGSANLYFPTSELWLMIEGAEG